MQDNENATDAANQESQPQTENVGEQKMFSQDDVNKILKERLARLEQKQQKTLESQISERLSLWKEENGIDDEVLEKIKNKDKQKMEERVQKQRITKMENEMEVLRKKLHRVTSEAASAAVFKAASPYVSDTQVFWDATSKNWKYDEDEGKLFVVGQNGEIDEDITPEDFIKKYTKEHPTLSKISYAAPGAGSRVEQSIPKTSQQSVPKDTEGRRDFLKQLIEREA